MAPQRRFVPRKSRFLAGLAAAPTWNFQIAPGLVLQRSRIRNAGFGLDTQDVEVVMLSWVVTFLIIALVAGLLGFGGIAGASIEIAKIVFFVAIVLFAVSALVGLMRGGRPTV
jgi:uncharacterized membrane protein YtjA (UPF0391 family)